MFRNEAVTGIDMQWILIGMKHHISYQLKEGTLVDALMHPILCFQLFPSLSTSRYWGEMVEIKSHMLTHCQHISPNTNTRTQTHSHTHTHSINLRTLLPKYIYLDLVDRQTRAVPWCGQSGLQHFECFASLDEFSLSTPSSVRFVSDLLQDATWRYIRAAVSRHL